MLANRPAPPPVGRGAPARPAVICFSHLRWSFVWQRPQHLLTRIAREMPVVLVEEPEFVPEAPADSLRVTAESGVTILTPLLARAPGDAWGFNDRTNPAIARLVGRALGATALADPGTDVIAWYYTPMALDALPVSLRPTLTVYDAMDELATFAGAPAGLRAREADLMRRADLVFTGGPSLYRARKDRHPRVHCFPSGVDSAHFAAARDVTRLPDDLAALTPPILGFYGVIDERMDRELVAAVADARPDWTLFLIGPVVKISDADLPRRDNIVYAGKRTYDELPAYLAGFDAAILPFARNDATRFISPTKTLEYMAAQAPIVSTPIRDVVELYGEVVEFGEDAPSFIAAVERLWSEPTAARERRAAAARTLLKRYDWNVIAGSMLNLLHERLAFHAGIAAGAALGTMTPLADAGFAQAGASD